MSITAILLGFAVLINRSLLDCRALRPLQHPTNWKARASSPLPEEKSGKGPCFGNMGVLKIRIRFWG